MMQALAKAGFTQSYTYFTWRGTKAEFTEYFTELTQTSLKRLFPRQSLAEYAGYFAVSFAGRRPSGVSCARRARGHALERLRHLQRVRALRKRRAPRPRRVSRFSEKYQWKERDWDAPGNIKDWITRLNRIRKENRALHFYDNLRFYQADNEAILFYGKMTPARDSIILIVVNLDPAAAQNSYIHVPLAELGLGEGEEYQMHDLLSDERYTWRGSRNYVELDPQTRPAHIFRVRRSLGDGRFA